MSENEKTYSLEELSDKVNFNKAFVKVVLRQIDIAAGEPISELDASRVAEKLKRAWPPTD